MMSSTMRRPWILGLVLAVVAGAGAYWAFGSCDLCLAQAIGSFNLTGSIAQNCTINVDTVPSGGTKTLTLEGTPGPAHIDVATVTQICNKKNGYTLTVQSGNCGTAAAGAKLVDPTNPPSGGGDWFSYSVAFHNNTTGSAVVDVTSLLASSCGTPTANDVTGKIANPGQTSEIYVDYNYASPGTVQVGTYSDTLTITMAVKT